MLTQRERTVNRLPLSLSSATELCAPRNIVVEKQGKCSVTLLMCLMCYIHRHYVLWEGLYLNVSWWSGVESQKSSPGYYAK